MLIPLLYSVLYGHECLGRRLPTIPLTLLLNLKQDGERNARSTSGAIIHPRPGVIVYVRETRSDPRPSSGTNNDALDCGYHRYIALHSKHLKNSLLFSDTWKFWSPTTYLEIFRFICLLFVYHFNSLILLPPSTRSLLNFLLMGCVVVQSTLL